MPYLFFTDYYQIQKLKNYRNCWNWWNLEKISDSNGIRTHNHLVRKWTLYHLASLAKWLSVRLRTKWLCVRIPLLPLKLQIWRLLRTRRSLKFRQTIECRFSLNLVRDIIITYSPWTNVVVILPSPSRLKGFP